MTAISIFASITVILNIIDGFIPHVHALSKIFLILIITIIGLTRRALLIFLFIIISYFINVINFNIF